MYSKYSKHWQLNEDITYLNHGSFGATPVKVLQKQQYYREEMERGAVDFFINKLPEIYQESKNSIANFVGTSAHNIVFVQNTTTGVNNVLANIKANENDDWLTLNIAYGACVQAFKHYAAKNKCNINVAIINYPICSKDDILKSIEQAITPKTTIALIDYITSSTGFIMPVEEIIELLHKKNITVIIDGAHAPGMIPLHIDTLKADYFVGNCHKWICSPKGSAIMYVAPHLQQNFYPLVISHYNDMNEGSTKHWSNQFFWDGTHDYSSYLCIKDAIETMPSIIEGTWTDIQKQNRELVLKAGKYIANKLQAEVPVPDTMVGSILNIPLPDGNIPSTKFHTNTVLQNILFKKYNIEAPIFNFPAAPKQWLRISAQLYNSIEQYEYLCDCLLQEL